jgi:NAD-dependent DNA ligase
LIILARKRRSALPARPHPRRGRHLHPEGRDLLALEGFKDKKVDNLLAGVEASKSSRPDRLLTALGIRFVGSVVAGLLWPAWAA